MKEQLRYAYFDVIRIFACVMVICIHVSAMDFVKYEINSGSWMALNVVNCIGMNGVPLFFMLSGALFLDENHRITLKKLLFGKILKLGILYYLVLFLYNIIPFIRGWVELTPVMIKETIIEGMLYEKGVYHLWFLPVMMLLYLMSPILKEAFQKKRICEYFLLLFFCGEALLYTMTLFEYHGAIKRFVIYCQEKNALFPMCAYIGYFVLGHYLHQYVNKLFRKDMIFVVLLAVVANMFTIIVCYLDSWQKGYLSMLANSPLAIGNLISSSCIFLLIKQFCNKINSDRKKKILRIVADCTLGVYLLHPMIINNVEVIRSVEAVVNNALLLTVLRVIFVSLISFIIVIILKPFCKPRKLFQNKNR